MKPHALDGLAIRLSKAGQLPETLLYAVVDVERGKVQQHGISTPTWTSIMVLQTLPFRWTSHLPGRLAGTFLAATQ